MYQILNPKEKEKYNWNNEQNRSLAFNMIYIPFAEEELYSKL